MKRILLIFHFLVASLVAMSQTDTTNTEEIYDMTLEELMNMSVSTASKVAQKATDAPATVYVVTAQQIEDRNYASLKELLRDIPQVEINEKVSSETSDTYTINGVRGNEKFIILVDGIRANSSTGTPHAIDQSFSLANVKQVEVILGPASALYGADAFTGIINIITFKGHENKGIYLNSSYGMFNSLSGTLHGGFGNEKLSFSFAGKYYHSDEPFMPDYYENEFGWYNHFKQTGEMQIFGNTIKPAMGFKEWGTPTDAYNARARINYKNFEVGYTYFHESHSSSVGSSPKNYYFTDETLYTSQMQNLYLTHTYTNNNEKLTLTSTLSVQEYETLPNSLYINQFSGFEKAYKYEQNQTLKWEEQLNYRHSDKLSLVGGAMYEYVHAIPITSDLPWKFTEDKSLEEQKFYYPGTNITDSTGKDLTIYQDIFEVEYYNVGAYLQAQYTLFENFNITAGTRFDYNSRFNSTINPRIGIVYKPTEKLTFKLLYGQAYLAPSPYVAYQHYGSFYPITSSTGKVAGLGGAYWRLSNPDLEPETRKSFDFQGIYQVNQSFAISVNGYYSTITNLIITQGLAGQTFKGVTIGWVDKPVNAGEALTYGGTLRADYIGKLTESIQANLFMAYSYSDGNITDDNTDKPLILSAKNTFKTGFGIRWNKLDVYLNFRHLDGTHAYSSTNANEVVVDAFNVLDATTNFKLVDNDKYKIGLFLNASNILDARFYNAGNTNEDFPFAPQDPRWITFGVKLGLKQ